MDFSGNDTGAIRRRTPLPLPSVNPKIMLKITKFTIGLTVIF